MMDSRRKSVTTRLPALALPAPRRAPLSGDSQALVAASSLSATVASMTVAAEQATTLPFPETTTNTHATSPPSLPPILSTAPFAQRAAWLQALFLEDILSGKSSKPIPSTLRAAERRWAKALPGAASHLEDEARRLESVRRAGVALAHVLGAVGGNVRVGCGLHRSGRSAGAKLLAWLGLGDRRAAACACRALWVLEEARRGLAARVERNTATRLRLLSFLRPEERGRAAVTNAAWAASADPGVHGGALPPALDLVLLVDTSCPDAKRFACPKALGRAAAILAAAVPGLELRCGGVVFHRFPDPLPDSKWALEGFPPSALQAATGALRRRNNETGPVGVDHVAVGRALAAAEALERRACWRATLGGWLKDPGGARARGNETFVVRRTGLAAFDPRGNYLKDKDDDEEDEEEEEEGGENEEVAEVKDKDGGGVGPEEGGLDESLAPAWARHDAMRLRKWRHQEARRRAAEVKGRSGYDNWVAEEKEKRATARRKAANERAEVRAALRERRAKKAAAVAARANPDAFAACLRRLGGLLRVAYGEEGASESEAEEIEDDPDPTEKPAAFAAGLAALFPDCGREGGGGDCDHGDDGALGGRVGAAAAPPGVGAPLWFRPHATKVGVVLCASSPLGLELEPHEDAPFAAHGDPSGLDPVALLHRVRGEGGRGALGGMGGGGGPPGGGVGVGGGAVGG